MAPTPLYPSRRATRAVLRLGYLRGDNAAPTPPRCWRLLSVARPARRRLLRVHAASCSLQLWAHPCAVSLAQSLRCALLASRADVGVAARVCSTHYTATRCLAPTSPSESCARTLYWFREAPYPSSCRCYSAAAVLIGLISSLSPCSVPHFRGFDRNFGKCRCTSPTMPPPIDTDRPRTRTHTLIKPRSRTKATHVFACCQCQDGRPRDREKLFMSHDRTPTLYIGVLQTRSLPERQKY